MDMAQHTVWTLMTGGLLSLVLLSVVDAVVTRNLGAWRNVLLIVSIAGVCVLLSGLPEVLFPGLPQRPGMMLKAGLGPLVSALGLRLLGLWVGGAREDHVVHRLTVAGSLAIMLGGLVLMVMAAVVPREEFSHVLVMTATLNAIPVLLCLVAALRAALLGDVLARWLVLACVILAGMVAGLYLQALQVEGFGLGTWIFTAVSSVVFVLITMVLIIVRNRDLRRLARLARLESGSDPATGLRTGAKLVSEVEHVFWRTGRLRGKCVMVCVYLNNLYELGDSMGRAIDNQILAATAARIRRAAGFRCVVGLYHARCFIIVFSTDMKREVDEAGIVQRMRAQVAQPLPVVGHQDKRQQFVPQVGMSLMTFRPDHVQAQELINELEHRAMEEARQQVQGDDQIDTVW